jgi:hypothetical protein
MNRYRPACQLLEASPPGFAPYLDKVEFFMLSFFKTLLAEETGCYPDFLTTLRAVHRFSFAPFGGHLSKRYIVGEFIIRLRSLTGSVFLRLPGRGVRLIALSLAAQKLDIVCDHLYPRASLAVLLPPFLAQFSIHPYLLPLNEILVEVLSLFAPDHNVEKVGFIDPLVTAFPAPIDGKGELAHPRPTCGVFQLRVPGEPSHQNDVIYVCHGPS